MFRGDCRHVAGDASAAAPNELDDDRDGPDPRRVRGDEDRPCDERSCGRRCAYRKSPTGCGGAGSHERTGSDEPQEDEEEKGLDEEEEALVVDGDGEAALVEEDGVEYEEEEEAAAAQPLGPLNAIAAAISVDWRPCPENACVACDRFRYRCGPADGEPCDECLSCSQNFMIVMGNADDGGPTPAPVTGTAATATDTVTVAADQRRQCVTRKRKTSTAAKTCRNTKNKKK